MAPPWIARTIIGSGIVAGFVVVWNLLRALGQLSAVLFAPNIERRVERTAGDVAIGYGPDIALSLVLAVAAFLLARAAVRTYEHPDEIAAAWHVGGAVLLVVGTLVLPDLVEQWV